MKRGSDKLTFAPRIGGYAKILARLFRSARRQAVGSGDAERRPLERLNFAAEKDVSVGLLRAWAAVGDVISFYQQRVRDEGRLETAEDARSVELLTAMTGYRPPFARPSRTVLTYRLDPSRDGREEVAIPAGPATQLLSAPKGQAPPSTFENAAAFTARRDWDEIAILPPEKSAPQMLANGALGAEVAGGGGGLRVGGRVLLVLGEYRVLRTLSKVERDVKQNLARLRWSAPLKLPTDSPQALSAVYSFRQTAGLFGARAADWTRQPDAVKARTGQRRGGVLLQPGDGGAAFAADRNLPTTGVRALASGGGAIYAATAKGVYRSDNGQWRLLPTVPPRFDAHSLAVAPDGEVLAGGARGAVLASSDGGESWRQLGTGLARPEPAASITRLLKIVLGVVLRRRAPPTVAKSGAQKPPATALPGAVTALAVGDGEHGRFFVAGTESGVFIRLDTDRDWSPYSKGLPGYNRKTGLASAAVFDLICVRRTSGGKPQVLAATDRGLFASLTSGADWRLQKLDPAKPRLGALCVAHRDGVVYAGTEDGLFVCVRGNWRRSDVKALNAGPVSALAAAPAEGRAKTEMAACARDAVFVLSGGAWRRWDRRVRPFFAAPDAFSSSFQPGSPDPALAALFEEKGAKLPPGAKLAKGARAGRWILRDGEGGPVHYRLRSHGGSLRVLKIEPRAAAPPVACVIGARGQVLTAAAPGAFLDTDWPGFEIETPRIRLDRALAGVAAGSVVVLSDGSRLGAYRAKSARAAPVEAFGRRGVVTEIAVDPDANLAGFDLRNTSVLTQSVRHAPVAARRPESAALGGDRVAAATSTRPPVGRLGVLTGVPAPAALAAPGGFGPAGGGVRSAPGLDATAVAAVDGGVAVGDARGRVFMVRWRDGQADWTRALTLGSPIWSLASRRGRLYAASARGAVAVAGGWCEEIRDGAPPSPFIHLATGLDDALFAATAEDGVYRLSDDGHAWIRYAAPLDRATVRRIALDRTGQLYAASEGGLLRVDDGRLRPVDAESGRFDAHDLAIGGDGAIFLGVAGDVLVRRGELYGRMNCPASGAVVSRLLISPDSSLWAAGAGLAPVRFRTREGWAPPPTTAINDVSDLISCGASPVAAYRARWRLAAAAGEARTAQDAFLGAGPGSIANGAAGGLVSPELLRLFANHGVTLASDTKVLAGPGRGEWIVRSGEDAFRMLLSETEDACAVYRTPLFAAEAANGRVTLTDNGFEIRPSGSEMTLLPAAAGAPPASEVVRVAAAEPRADGGTEITFAAPLKRFYSWAGARLSLNAGEAVEGQTIGREPLAPRPGDGRSYAAPRGPVLARADDPELVSMEVFVGAAGTGGFGFTSPHGAPQAAAAVWREVRALGDQPKGARVYAATSSGAGATVSFGDGAHGARPPAGSEVGATWRIRTGDGDGAAAAGAVRQFRNRPPGVRSATNPLPATGGATATGTEEIRAAAPAALRDDGPLVGLDDFARAARARPDVATAIAVAAPEEDAVLVCIAGRPGAPPDTGAVADALNARRAGATRMTVMRAVDLPFRLRLAAAVEAGHSFEDVAPRLHDRLRRWFDDGGAGVGRDLDRSDIETIADAVDGVARIIVTELRLSIHAPALFRRLTARDARWAPEARAWAAAEILRPNAGDGIVITEATDG